MPRQQLHFQVYDPDCSDTDPILVQIQVNLGQLLLAGDLSILATAVSGVWQPITGSVSFQTTIPNLNQLLKGMLYRVCIGV